MKKRIFLASLLTAVLIVEAWGGQKLLPKETKNIQEIGVATAEDVVIEEDDELFVSENYFVEPLTDTNYLSVASGNIEELKISVLAAVNESGNIGIVFPEIFDSALAETDYYIETVEQLKYFQTASKSNTFEGITIHLAADIDWDGTDFAGIGSTATPFKGIFNGHGYAITKLSSTTNGLFAVVEGATIKNLAIGSAKVVLAEETSNIGILIGEAKGTTVENIVIAGSKITSGAVKVSAIGGVIGKASGEISITQSDVKRLTIKTAGLTNAVGGFVGQADAKVAISDSDIANSYIKDVYKNARKQVSSFGGVIGDITAKATVENVNAVAVNISATSLAQGLGGIVGTISGTEGSKFKECKVSVGRISATSNQNDSLSGLAGKVESASVFQKCAVENSTVVAKNNSQYVGGIAGYLSETAKISDSYVQGFRCADSTDTMYLGGLVGYVTYITEEPSTISSCYVKDANLSGKSYLGNIIGMCETEYSAFSSLWYLNSTITLGRGGTLYSGNGEIKGTEDAFTKGEAAWSLNTANGTKESSGMWTQGLNVPTYDTETTLPTVRVSFVQPSGTIYRYTNAMGNVALPEEVDQDYAWPTETYFVIDSVVNAKFSGILGTIFPVPMNSKPTKKEYTIKTKEQLESFQQASFDYDFTGITIHVLADIDWGGENGGDWQGIGLDETLPFTGTFDGHGYTIKNLYSKTSGLFYVAGSTASPVTIKDFTLENAKVSGGAGMAIVVSQINGNPQSTEDGGSAENAPNLIEDVHVVSSEGKFSGDNCGIFVGRGVNNADAVAMESCSVKNTTLTCTANKSTNVKNWGILIGNDHGNGLTKINECIIENSHIVSSKCNFTNAGLAVGLITGGTNIQGCQVISSSITSGCSSETLTEEIGGLVGRIQSTVGEISDCTMQDVQITTNGLSSGLGLVIGQANGGVVNGCVVNGGSIHTNYNATDTQASHFGGIIGRIAVSPVRVLNCETNGVLIQNASRAHSIGGLIGSVEESSAESVIAKCSVTNFVLNNTYTSNTQYIYHIGGALGRTMAKAHITDVSVENANITTDAMVMSMGGFIGYISGDYPSVLTDCSVKNSNIKQTAINDSYKCLHVGGLAGDVDTASKFAGCSVTNTDIVMQGRTYYYGGLIGSTYSTGFGEKNRESSITVKNCYVKDCDLTTKQSRNCNQYGGLIGWLTEGSTIQNCYVSGITNTVNTKCKKIGGLVGYISNVGATEPTTIKSCYVENCDFRANQEASGMIGTSDASNTVFEDLYYYNCVLTGTTDSAVAGTEITTSAELTDGTVMTQLNNASLGTIKNWKQGNSSPILNPDCNGTTEVKMLCYNIYYLAQDEAHPIENRRTKVLNYMKKYIDQGVDIMALQEVQANTWYSHLSEFVKQEGWTWTGYGRFGGTFEGYAVGATSASDAFNLIIYNPEKYIKVDEGHFWASDTPEVKSAFYSLAYNYRVINWVKLRDRETGEDFIFADAHLEETRSGTQTNQWGYTLNASTSNECRVKQAQLISDQLAKQATGGIPIIQAGDYNAATGTDPYNKILETGYQCVRNFSQVADTHGGYNAWTRQIEKFAKGDHVFTSPLCTSNIYDVRAEDDIDVETGYRISDHCAIYTIIYY